MANTSDAHTRFSDFAQLAPDVVNALASLGKAVERAGLEKPLLELIKIRASQINGCAFCLQYHLQLARKVELPQTKLDLLPCWRDAGLYTAREMAALAWTEALTGMASHSIPAQLHTDLQQHFSASEIAHLSAAIGQINAWNRIAGGLHFPPELPAQTA